MIFLKQILNEYYHTLDINDILFLLIYKSEYAPWITGKQSSKFGSNLYFIFDKLENDDMPNNTGDYGCEKPN